MSDHDELAEPDSAGAHMSLESAIATHPELWSVMGKLWRRDDEGPDGLVLEGMILALSIVGGFQAGDIAVRLLEDFG